VRFGRGCGQYFRFVEQVKLADTLGAGAEHAAARQYNLFVQKVDVAKRCKLYIAM